MSYGPHEAHLLLLVSSTIPAGKYELLPLLVTFGQK